MSIATIRIGAAYDEVNVAGVGTFDRAAMRYGNPDNSANGVNDLRKNVVDLFKDRNKREKRRANKARYDRKAA